MKKMKRAICLIAVFVLCVSLCGCGVLDDIRATRAVYTDEGNIQLKGAEYKLLPQCKELTPDFNVYTELYVVPSDVPLLLTSMMGEYLDISDDGMFLSNYTGAEELLYCRADVYDSVYHRIINGYDLSVCAYWDYDYYTGEDIPVVLTQQQLDAIRQVLETQEPQTLPSSASLGWDYGAFLYMCSSDLLFRKPMVDICVADGIYYVLDETNGETIYYPVPAELIATFVQIVQPIW